MRYTAGQIVFWLTLYLVLAVAPMELALVGAVPETRSFWIELSVMLGFLALSTLNLQFVVTGRFRWFAAGFGLDNLLQFHRQTGIFALLLVLTHPLILLVHDRGFLAYLDPRENLPRAVFLCFAVAATTAIVVTSLFRLSLGLSYERWRLIHGALSLGVILIGLAHVLQVGHYSAPFWKQAVFVAMTAGAAYLLLHSRIIRPLRMRRRPYRVVAVTEGRGPSVTVALEPEGHEGMDFRPGQFAWITIGDSPLSMQQHPFSIASSPGRRRYEFTMKGQGDFVSSVKDIPVGTRAFLEGPYGAFIHGPEEARDAVFIAGGVGITPIMSMLRAYRDRGARRDLMLIYTNKDWESVIFRDEIEALKEAIGLRVVHVLDKPEPGWTGETGRIDADLLARHLPADVGAYDYFLCGPPRMMDAVEPLLRQRGIAARRIFSERFNMV